MSNVLDDKLSKIGNLSSEIKGATSKVASYLDERGNETFYIKNVGEMNVYLTSLASIVNRGEVIDLLTRTDIDNLNKDQSLRSVINNGMLKRLTKEEFIKEEAEYTEILRRKEVEREEIQLRPVVSDSAPIVDIEVQDKVDRLKYYYSPDQKSASNCITPNEFMEWLVLAKLSVAEIDFIISNVPNAEVKAFLFKKKSEIISNTNQRY